MPCPLICHIQDLVYICMNQDLECRPKSTGKILELFWAMLQVTGNTDLECLRGAYRHSIYIYVYIYTHIFDTHIVHIENIYIFVLKCLPKCVCSRGIPECGGNILKASYISFKSCYYRPSFLQVPNSALNFLV